MTHLPGTAIRVEGNWQRGYLHNCVLDKHVAVYQLKLISLIFQKHNHHFVHWQCKWKIIMFYLLTDCQQNLLQCNITIRQHYLYSLSEERRWRLKGRHFSQKKQKTKTGPNYWLLSQHSEKYCKGLPDRVKERKPEERRGKELIREEWGGEEIWREKGIGKEQRRKKKLKRTAGYVMIKWLWKNGLVVGVQTVG